MDNQQADEVGRRIGSLFRLLVLILLMIAMGFWVFDKVQSDTMIIILLTYIFDAVWALKMTLRELVDRHGREIR